jgi:hypothetical protein
MSTDDHRAHDNFLSLYQSVMNVFENLDCVQVPHELRVGKAIPVTDRGGT